MGDLHNLFGEAHEVLVTVDEEGRVHIDDVLPGESCERVLEYMNYDKAEIFTLILLDGRFFALFLHIFRAYLAGGRRWRPKFWSESSWTTYGPEPGKMN